MKLKSDVRTQERRSENRVIKRLPVRVGGSANSSETTAHTRDVSTHGLFFYTESRIVEGSDVDLILLLPPELTDGQKSWVCCHARVVRVEPGSGQELGVAAAIERIDVLPEVPARLDG